MSQVSDRHGICRGNAFWKLNYQLCMKGWSWASSGVPWLALGFHGLAQGFQSWADSSSTVCGEFCQSFLREHPTRHSPTCLFLPFVFLWIFLAFFSSSCLHHHLWKICSSCLLSPQVNPSLCFHFSLPLPDSVRISETSQHWSAPYSKHLEWPWEGS